MMSILQQHTSGPATTASSPVAPVSLHRTMLTIEPGRESRLVFLTDPAGLAVQQQRILSRRLINSHPEGGALLITSPGAGEGKTLTAVNLAWALASAGQDTCLLDLDFRAPGVARALGCPAPQEGVEDVLDNSRKLLDAVRRIDGTRMHVLAIRDRLDSSARLLSPTVINPALAILRPMFEWVVLDFAPVLPMADVGDALAYVDGAILVIRSGKTAKKMIPPSLEALGPKLWGVVLNDSPVLGGAAYGDYGNRRD